MAKRILLIVIVVPLLLCAILLGIAGSESGTRAIISQARQLTGDLADWQQVEGSLLGPLEIRGLRVAIPGTQASIERLQLDWSPASLLLGKLEVNALTAEGVNVLLEPSDEKEDSGPIDLSALQPPLDIALHQLSISNIRVQSGDGEPQQIDSVSLSAFTSGDAVDLRQLHIRAPQGTLDATGKTALNNALPLDLQAKWQWQLADGRKLGGALTAQGNAQSLQVQHKGSGDLPINLQGKLRTLLDAPGWDVALDWPALPVDTAEQAIIVGPGAISSTGSLEQFSLRGEGDISGATPETLSWTLDADNGTASSLHLNSLQLASTPGVIAFSGDLTWDDPVHAALRYSAVGEGLSAYNPDLPDRLDASGHIEAEYAGENAVLKTFDLALAQSPMRLSLQAEAQLPPDTAPAFDARLAWSDLAWPLVAPEGASPAFTSSEGRVNLAGTTDDYRLTLVASTAGEQAPAVTWSAEGHGNAAGLTLTPMVAKTLDGELQLSGDISWSPDITWALQASGKDLNPGTWQADYPGKLALALQTRGRLDPDTGVQAQLALDYLKGELSGQPFDLAADASVAGDTVDLAKLYLHSGSNRFDASGKLSTERLALQWQLDAPQPHTLVPGASGQLKGNGNISGSLAKPRLEAHLEGDMLAYQFQSLDKLRADIRAGLADDAPLVLDLHIQNLVDGETTLVETASLAGNGSTGAHTLELMVQTPGDKFDLKIAGGLDSDAMAWAGKLEALSADTAGFGQWNLDAPAAMQISAKAQTMEQVCLASPQDSAKVCASGSYRGADGGQFALLLEALPVARLMAAVGGELNGQVEGSLGANGSLNGEGKITLSAGELRLTDSGGANIAHNGGEINLSLSPEAGLNSNIVLEGTRQRLLEASVQLPQLRQFPLLEPQPLAGNINADLDDLSGLSALVPELSKVSGRLYADLQLAGELSAPHLQGRLALENASAVVLPADIELEHVHLALEGDPQRPGYLYLTGGADSGPGNIALDGQFNLQDQHLDLLIKGDRLEVWDTRDGRALVSPDLKINWDGDLATVRGRVEIPRADITPKLAIRPGMASEEEIPSSPEVQVIATSADVVILGPDGEPIEDAVATLPFRLDSEVELVLGDRVRVNALGFRGRIAGAVKFVNRPRRRELIPIAEGRFSIEDGTFQEFGQDLDIETGQIIFDRVPATEPELAVRAVRWIENDPMVSAAGVQISGPLDQPLLELFSRPQLEPSEIQSYLLTGQSASSDEGTSIGTGRFINRKLYVGYGYNLIAETSEFDALYTITPRYGIEVSAGEADNRVNFTFTYEN